MRMHRIFMVIGAFLVLSSCQEDEGFIATPEVILAGGETTIFSSGPDAFTFPLANLEQDGIERHFEADGIFGQQFVSAPAIKFGGIGPLFNQNSCESCHTRNGRGAIPQFEGDQTSGLLLRLSIPGVGPNNSIVPVPGFGGQLQNKAIFGVTPEGKVSMSELEEIVQYVDGTQLALTKLYYEVREPYTSLPAETMISPRVAPPVFGLGLLEAISSRDILALADEADADGDGISGKPNMVWDVLKQDMAMGRFGWKAEQPSAVQQSADAAHNDMGLTNFIFSNNPCEGQGNCDKGLQEENDLDEETILLFAFYSQTLAVPSQRNTDQPEVINGKKIFSTIQCASCHVPEFTTGAHEITSVSNQKISPFTDMLLHDMGEGLADNRPTFDANGQEWRTTPLWGIGLTKVVNPKATFLHDGRAKTIEEAILWHGGEAEASKEKFRKLKKSDREDLLTFLKSL